MRNWISLTEAARQLGVRAQTVYAYASRGRISVMPDPRDPRKSLYRAEDVAGLSRRKQVGRKRETLAAGTIFGAEPCFYTGLTAFSKGRLYYRGMDAIDLSAQATLEDVGALLWDAQTPLSFDATESPLPGLPAGRACVFATLGELAARGNSTRGRVDRALHVEAGALVGLVARAFGAYGGTPGAPIHKRLAHGWGQGADVAEQLRRAMVLVADHELTSSAFSTRITASTGASLPACLLSGLATFSGPLHGDASGRVQTLFEDVERLGAEKVVAHHLRSAIPIPGFGHHLYPDGDTRAAALLAELTPPPQVVAFIDRVVALTGLRPNIDIALAALAAQYQLPVDAGFALFATARSVGLLAHCMEQLKVGMVIRPRGRYTGPALQEPPSAAFDSPQRKDAGPPDVSTVEKNRIFKRPAS